MNLEKVIYYKEIPVFKPFSKEKSIICMQAVKELYEESFKRRELRSLNFYKIQYEYYRKKAIEFKVDISNFPKELNYMEMQN